MPSISHIPIANKATSYLQMQNLWHIELTSSSHSTHFFGASRISLVENSAHLMFSEKHTNIHGGSSSASKNNSNDFIQSSGTHMMMSDFSESSLSYQSNDVIQSSSGPTRDLRSDGVGDTGRTANFLSNNSDPQPHPLVIVESTIATVNRESILSVAESVREPGHRDDPIVIEADSVREPGHRDDPIIIEDDEEDEHDNAQQGVIFYDGNLSYEALLALQERIGDVGTGLKKKFISELLKKRKYQSIKMNDCSDSCSICLDTYGDGEELGKIDCDHEFHSHCIRKWLKIKNFCPICKRTALTP